MLPRFITKEIHVYLDYPVALTLMALPFLLSLGSINPLAFWLSVVTGVAALILTVLTDHHLGLIKVLPYSLHLVVDGLVGVAFVVTPLVLGFVDLEFWYYMILGLTVLVVVGLHKAEENPVAA